MNIGTRKTESTDQPEPIKAPHIDPIPVPAKEPVPIRKKETVPAGK